ncbi:MAG TPA: hypothetical protein IAA79_00420 [Candidatus Avirikenella pullistercoris]|nr:hypothetical protein [Candidatus Avirikenella pullistercoris]
MEKIERTLTRKSIGKVKKLFAEAIAEAQSAAENVLPKEKIADTFHRKQEEYSQIVDEAEPVFKYSLSKYCKYTTFVVSLLILGIFLYFFFSSSGTYLSAWFMSIALAVCLLFVISFPRRIKITDSDVEIHCVLEMTNIPLADIKRIHPIERYRLKRIIPILGSYGFGGFYGYYFDLMYFRVIRMYATKLSGLVIIQNIYNERYIVNCENPRLLIGAIRKKIENIRTEASFEFNSSEEYQTIEEEQEDD